MVEESTIDTIMGHFEKCAREKIPLAPASYLEAAAKVNALKGSEYDLLYEMEQECAKAESTYLEADMTSSAAKTRVKSLPIWLQWKKQVSRVKQIEDFILLAKKFASLKMDEMRNNLD